jgi:transcriptional regulator with XRE-family HTH domain
LYRVTVKSTSADRPELAIDVAFGAAARRLRTARGLTLDETVERMNALGATMHNPTLSRLETGGRRWNTRYIALVCAALEVDPLEFVTELLPPDAVEVTTALRTAGLAGVVGWLARQMT